MTSKCVARRIAAGIALVLGFASAAADAEIYRWVDASGGVTFSDRAPPAGVRVTDVIHVDPPLPAATVEAAHEAEMRMLAQRVRLLELERDRSERVAMAPPPAYAPAPPAYESCNPSAVDCDAVLDGAAYLPLYWGGARLRHRGPDFAHRRVAVVQTGGRFSHAGGSVAYRR
jgi:Domain of unknown function (DUF4124)